MKKYLGLLLVLIISWSLPLYGLIYNALYPSYESALGVAYGFALGCVVHLLGIIIWIGIRRRRLQKIELIILLTSFCFTIALTVISNNGSLSKFSWQQIDVISVSRTHILCLIIDD